MKNSVIVDIEIYHNFFCVGCYFFDLDRYECIQIQHFPKFIEFLEKKRPTLITFNGIHYDLRILSYALTHYHDDNIVEALKFFSDYIIVPPKEKIPELEHHRWWSGTPQIDLKNVLGGRICPSLKKLAVRLHLDEVEALPIPPDKILTDTERQQIIEYNKLDCLNTKKLLEHCKPLLELRKSLGNMYKVDCMSLADSQIAEKIMSAQLQGPTEKFTEQSRPVDAFVTGFHYETPQNFYNRFQKTWIKFDKIYDPLKGKHTFKKYFLEEKEKLIALKIDDIVPPVEYKFGGLHSIHSKKSICGEEAYEADVASFYPYLILNYGIFPESVGEEFLAVYRNILERRLAAKKAGNKIEADSLKIVLNSVFGKFNEIFSKLHDPLAGASVCLHGECAILRLMDMCYQEGIEVLLVNTDGIVTKQNPSQVIDWWQQELKMTLETKKITKYVIKDSNNHILKYADGSIKVKGIAFANESSASKQTNFAIVQKALVECLMNGVPMETTIRECKDLHQFVGCYVKGPSILELKSSPTPDEVGLVMPNLVRWYIGESGQTLYRRNIKTVTKIADSENFINCNKMPISFPDDLNYNQYIKMASTKLQKLQIGASS